LYFNQNEIVKLVIFYEFLLKFLSKFIEFNMETVIINASEQPIEAIYQAVNLLKTGFAIVFPTETVYGLGVNLFDEKAVRCIYEIKSRNFTKPLTAHLCDIGLVSELAENIPDEFYHLADKFLPGPLTIILEKKKAIPDEVTSGFNTIGIRIPDNEIFRKISTLFGRPIAATSANISKIADSISAEQAYTSLKDKVPMIIDGGETVLKISSTVLSLVRKPYEIFREGIITKSMIENELGNHCILL